MMVQGFIYNNRERSWRRKSGERYRRLHVCIDARGRVEWNSNVFNFILFDLE